MRKANLLKIITNTSLTVGLGALTLFGGVARADTFQQRVQAELNRGKDYSAAWEEASRALGPLYSSDTSRETNYARNGMYRGLDYSAAWEEAYRPASDFAPQEVAKAAKAREEIDQGVDYAQAWTDADKDQQPAQPVRAASKSGGASGYERARTIK